MSGWDAFGHLTTSEKSIAGKILLVDPATVYGPQIGLIVGEMPPKLGNPETPMFPYPANSPGGKLQKLSKLTMGEFLGRIRRVNLFTTHQETWDPLQARVNAVEITQSLLPGTRVVLCGARVGRAFDLNDYFVNYEHAGSQATCIPHPHEKKFNEINVRAAAGLAIRWAADLRKR